MAPNSLDDSSSPTVLAEFVLPPGIRSRVFDGINGLALHCLEAGYETPGRPGVLLLHGFPELAYSWRHVMPLLAKAGFHVIAPDRRGYGRTTGWRSAYDTDLQPFGVLNQVGDMLALVAALGHRSVAVVGHDFGSPLAAWCALTQPRIFTSVAMISSPFTGPPATAIGETNDLRELDLDLGALAPPRKHYLRYYATREANSNMWSPAQGLRDFLRAYFHVKSADWPHNDPHRLQAFTAEVLARLPTYYVMEKSKGMAETVAPFMPSDAQIGSCRWLTDDELRVYVSEYGRTGFQGGLNEYRCLFDLGEQTRLREHAGRTIDVPAKFISGASDWGVYQSPGALQQMTDHACSKFSGVQLLEGAGHWAQQEKPAELTDALLHFWAG